MTLFSNSLTSKYLTITWWKVSLPNLKFIKCLIYTIFNMIYLKSLPEECCAQKREAHYLNMLLINSFGRYLLNLKLEQLTNWIYRFIEKYLLCTKCKYPETTLFLKQKQLASKCRACGTIQQLDSTHRAGAQLMKQLPKDMSEIEAKDTKEGKAASKEESTPSQESSQTAETATDEKKKKKKKEEDVFATEALTIESEEIGKLNT